MLLTIKLRKTPGISGLGWDALKRSLIRHNPLAHQVPPLPCFCTPSERAGLCVSAIAEPRGLNHSSTVWAENPDVGSRGGKETFSFSWNSLKRRGFHKIGQMHHFFLEVIRKKKTSVSIAKEEEPAFPFFFVLVAHFSRRDFQYDNEVFYSKEYFLTTTSELMYEKRSASSEAY